MDLYYRAKGIKNNSNQHHHHVSRSRCGCSPRASMVQSIRRQ